jgi:hypothetical protein
MTITFKWKLTPHVTAQATINGATVQEVVKVLDWELIGSDGSQEVVRSDVQILQWPNPDVFVPLSAVTPDMLAAWLSDALGAAKIKEVQEDIKADFISRTVEVPDACLSQLDSVIVSVQG